MAYRDCPCLKCNSGKEREKRIKCRRKCTQFVAWKLSMQAMRQKKKEDKELEALEEEDDDFFSEAESEEEINDADEVEDEE